MKNVSQDINDHIIELEKGIYWVSKYVGLRPAKDVTAQSTRIYDTKELKG